MGKQSIALFVAVAAFGFSLAIATPAIAAKGGQGGGGGGSSSLSLVLLDSSDGLPHAGHQVTFAVSTTATTSPFVSLNCYQGGGVWVYTASAGFFAAYPWSKNFTLSTTAWMSGAADCTARLYSTKTGTRTTTLATATFHVYP